MTTPTTLLPSLPVTNRIRSIDWLRGLIMVLMAIDHVRVYSGQPAGGPTYDIFFTRWITHFCAPGFVFFAGTAAFLYGQKAFSKKQLAGFLLSRGLLLAMLELTLIKLSWTFNFSYSFILAGVIWMIGCCMVLMAALVWLRAEVVGIMGVLIIVLQPLFSYVPLIVPEGMRESFGLFWEFIYPSGGNGPEQIGILYVLVPWIGVMAAGYGFGMVMLKEPAIRNRICIWVGLSATVLFVVVAGIITLRREDTDQVPFLIRMLNQRKYPASVWYLLMTLGPLIALIPFAEKVKGWLSDTLVLFGRVPFFYYLLHIPLIHASALLVNIIRTGSAHADWYVIAPFAQVPPEQRWSLWLLYGVYVIDVALLYFLCRWYAGYKALHPGKRWLRYL